MVLVALSAAAAECFGEEAHDRQRLQWQPYAHIAHIVAGPSGCKDFAEQQRDLSLSGGGLSATCWPKISCDSSGNCSVGSRGRPGGLRRQRHWPAGRPVPLRAARGQQVCRIAATFTDLGSTKSWSQASSMSALCPSSWRPVADCVDVQVPIASMD